MIHRIKRFLPLFCLTVWLLVFAIPAWAAFQVPPPQGYVTDRADVIPPETELQITQIAQELKQKTDSEIAVLTIDSLEGAPIEQAALETGRQWGVGSKKAGNTGVLLLVAIQDRQMRIEVGYGIEGIITDGTAGQIRDELIVPAFRQGDYSLGILRGVAAIALRIADAHQVSLDSLAGEAVPEVTRPAAEELPESVGNILFILFFILLFGSFILLQQLHRKGLMPRDSGRPHGGYGGFGGGSFDGGGKGGFGGFGGGSFGGGGASGRW